jgi:DNA-binding CsgD family transcriptional regulator
MMASEEDGTSVASEEGVSAIPSINLSVLATQARLAEPDAAGPMRATRRGPHWTVLGRFTLNGRVYVLAQEGRAAGMDALTPREKEVVARTIRGDTAKVIAYDLGISHSTVRVLLARSYRRLGVTSREELLAVIKNFDAP